MNYLQKRFLKHQLIKGVLPDNQFFQNKMLKQLHQHLKPKKNSNGYICRCAADALGITGVVRALKTSIKLKHDND
jgi:hypothetical protein